MRSADLVRRLLLAAIAVWVGRWALLEIAALTAHLRPRRGEAPRDSARAPGHMPGPFDP